MTGSLTGEVGAWSLQDDVDSIVGLLGASLNPSRSGCSVARMSRPGLGLYFGLDFTGIPDYPDIMLESWSEPEPARGFKRSHSVPIVQIIRTPADSRGLKDRRSHFFHSRVPVSHNISRTYEHALRMRNLGTRSNRRFSWVPTTIDTVIDNQTAIPSIVRPTGLHQPLLPLYSWSSIASRLAPRNFVAFLGSSTNLRPELGLIFWTPIIKVHPSLWQMLDILTL